MSVIAFEPQKFAQVAATLSCDAREWMWAFGYPQGWEDRATCQQHIQAWAFDLMRANHATYRRQYAEKASDGPEMRLPHVAPIGRIALYKSLQAIRYNLVDNAGGTTDLNRSKQILDKVISGLADRIISALPEYEAADWC